MKKARFLAAPGTAGALLSGLLFLAVIFALGGCGDDDNPADSNLESRLLSAAGCKQFIAGKPGFDTPSSQTCVEYVYNSANTLRLTHINAGFNCCPGEIGGDIVIADNVITITESESESGCYCLCLFDLVFEIDNLPPGVYTIRIVEPYMADQYAVECGESIDFVVELLLPGSGSECFERVHYPWGI